MDKHGRLCEAMRECELSHDVDERNGTIRELASMGWRGGEVWPIGYMAMVLEKVSPVKFDRSLRKYGLRGYGEDVH